MKQFLNQVSFSSSITLCFLVSALPAKGQIASDGTTPTNINQTDNVFEITGGAAAGGNLFHSFQEFSVPTGNEAFFNNADTIDNIISRVTGGNVSNIDGLIRANSANLFLINPKGIVFGPNASLNIGGSFLGSTADSIVFPEGEFSATDIQSSPLLTINAPIGLNFRDNPGTITNRSQASNGAMNALNAPVGLQVSPGQTLALIGGEINLENGNLTAPGGRIELGSVGENSVVDIILAERGFTLGYEAVSSFQDIKLSQFSLIDTTDLSGTINIGGSINLQGKSLTLTDTSQIFSFNSGTEIGNSLTINTSESVNLGAGTLILTQPISTGAAGDITIETNKLTVKDGGIIASAPSQFGGKSGNLTVRASDLVDLIGASPQSPTAIGVAVVPGATGDAQNLTVETGRLVIQDGAQLFTSTFGEGNAGNLTVKASDSIELIGTTANGQAPSGIFSQVFGPQATGDAGDLNIETKQLSVLGGAQISTAARNTGQGGNITIDASGSILLSGFSPLAIPEFGRSGVFVSAEPGATSNAGTLNINAGQLIVENGARISADNFGIGEGGNATLNLDKLIVRSGGAIRAGSLLEPNFVDTERGAGGTLTINATDSVEVIGTGDINGTPVQSSILTVAQGTGDAGDLNLTTNSLSIRDGGEISASSRGEADAGVLSIQATNIEVSDTITDNFFTGIFAEVEANASGTGGNLNTTSEQLTVSGNQARISVSNRGKGQAGNLSIATNQLILEEGAQVEASTFGEGNAGNVNINAVESIELRGEGEFPTGLFAQVNPSATGKGGSLTVETENLSISDGAKIQVSTFGEGDSGDLLIRASNIDVFETPVDNFFSTGIFAEVARSNAKGDAGDLTIETDNLSVRNGGQISASTLGEGNGGNLSIAANNSVEVVGVENPDITLGERNISTVSANVGKEAVGDGGSLTIETNSLRVADGGQVSVSTFGRGNAGDLQITATDSVEVSGTSKLTVEAAPNSIGNGGNLTINTRDLNLDSGEVLAATASGEGGNITLQIDDTITLRKNSLISAEATGTAKEGGNIDIVTKFILAHPDGNNDILASAEDGAGGNITITDADGIFGIKERPQSANTNDINATGTVDDGEIIITNPDVDITKGLVQTPQNVVEPEQTVAQACRIDRLTGKVSGLTVKGKGGIPPLPTEPMYSDAIIVNGKLTNLDPQLQSLDIKPIKTSQGDIYPARGIIKTEDGQIILTAYPTDIDRRTPYIATNCS